VLAHAAKRSETRTIAIFFMFIILSEMFKPVEAL